MMTNVSMSDTSRVADVAPSRVALLMRTVQSFDTARRTEVCL
jgi:hypothetical protein